MAVKILSEQREGLHWHLKRWEVYPEHAQSCLISETKQVRA